MAVRFLSKELIFKLRTGCFENLAISFNRSCTFASEKLNSINILPSAALTGLSCSRLFYNTRRPDHIRAIIILFGRKNLKQIANFSHVCLPKSGLTNQMLFVKTSIFWKSNENIKFIHKAYVNEMLINPRSYGMNRC